MAGVKGRSGRKKGSLNHRTKKIIAMAEASGILPLEAMLRIMRYWMAVADTEMAKGEKVDKTALHQALENAAQVAAKAAPYLHASIKATIQIPTGDASNAEYAIARQALAHLVRGVSDARQTIDGTVGTH